MLLETEGLFGGGTCSISVTNLEVLPHAQKEMLPLYSFGLMFGMGIIYNKSSQGSLLLPKPKISVATFLSAQDIAVHSWAELGVCPCIPWHTQDLGENTNKYTHI